MTIQSILDANETYAAAFAQSDPALLKKLAQGQSPKIFWLGCSDSRVSAELLVDDPPSSGQRERARLTLYWPPTRSTGVAPGSIFVHVSNPPLYSPREIPLIPTLISFSINRGLAHSATLLNASTPVTLPHPPPSPTQSTSSKSNPSSSAVRVPPLSLDFWLF